MSKSLLSKVCKDSSVYGVANVVAKLSSLISLPLMTRSFTSAQFGIVSIILSILPFTRFMISLEVSQSVAVFFSDTTDHKKKETIVSTGFWFTTAINISIILICAIVGFHMYGDTLNHIIGFKKSYLAILPFALIIDSLSYYCMNVLRWMDKIRAYAVFTAISVWLNVGSLFICIYIFHLGVNSLIVSWLLSWAMSFVLAFTKIKTYLKIAFDRKLLYSMIKFGFPLLLNNIPDKFNAWTDRYIIFIIMGASSLGIYSASAGLASLASVLFSSIDSALWPIVYKTSNSNEDKEKLVGLIYIMVILIGFLGCILSVMSGPVAYTLLGKKFISHEAIHYVVPLLSISCMISMLASLFPGIAKIRKNQFYIYATMVSLSINVLVGYFLTMRYGMVGMPIATCLAAVSRVLIIAIISNNFYPLPISLKYLSFSCCVSGAVFFIGFFTNILVPEFGFVSSIERVISMLIMLSLFVFTAVKIKPFLIKQNII